MKNHNINFIEFLKNNNKLFGLNSHIKLAPKKHGTPFRVFSPNGKQIRKSSVMILLKPTNVNDFNVLLTLRSQHLKSHSGQISFPGGQIEENETPLQAALRETFEEIGIPSEEIEVLSQLSELYVPPSNSLIHPFVGATDFDNWVINKSEVEEIIEVPFSFLVQQDNIILQRRQFLGETIEIPCWDLNKPEVLWGATAMILSELIDLYHYFEQIAIPQNF
ncbi:MAG: CoA pyrophosphatase [Bacteroidota bacterium]